MRNVKRFLVRLLVPLTTLAALSGWAASALFLPA